MNKKRRKTRSGWMLIDVSITISLLLILLICLSLTITASRGYNRYNLTRRQCLSAAQAQMDSLAARGHLLGGEDMARLFDGVEVSVERKAGDGDWQGMEMVQVFAVKKSGKQNVRIGLQRYMP